MNRTVSWRGGRGDRERHAVRRLVFLPALSLAALLAPPLSAQEIPPPELSVGGGAFHYDVARHGEGTVGFGAVRVRFPLGSLVLLEPSVSYQRYTAELEEDDPADEDVKLFLAEFQLQLQLPVDRFRPFVGLGAGGVIDFRDDRGTDDFMASTFSAAAGVAFDLGGGWSVRTEGRARGLDEFADNALEWGVGISKSF